MSTEHEQLMEVGRCAYASIMEMVAALECDYERLEELRDLKAEYVADGAADNWLYDQPGEAEELQELQEAAGECTDREDAEQRIQEDPLSLRIFGEKTNGEWKADRFELLLATGGPAVRIMGEIAGSGEPSRAWLEVQDWFTPWTQYFQADGETLLSYCRCVCGDSMND